MEITARIAHGELVPFFEGLFPLEIEFFKDAHKRRYLQLQNPRSIEMAPPDGILITCDATVHWPLLVDASFRAKDLTVLMCASSVPTEQGRGIRFTGRIEGLNVSLLPDFVDRLVAQQINEAIRKSNAGFTWNFSDNLSVAVDMPTEMVPIEAFTTAVETGALTVDDDGLTLRAPLDLSFSRREDAPARLRQRGDGTAG